MEPNKNYRPIQFCIEHNDVSFHQNMNLFPPTKVSLTYHMGHDIIYMYYKPFVKGGGAGRLRGRSLNFKVKAETVCVCVCGVGGCVWGGVCVCVCMAAYLLTSFYRKSIIHLQ